MVKKTKQGSAYSTKRKNVPSSSSSSRKSAVEKLDHHQNAARRNKICPDSIKGVDDAGTFYNSHGDLARAQSARRDEFYDANNKYWQTGGGGGRTDDEAMVGDCSGIQDAEEGLQFLDRLIAHYNDDDNDDLQRSTSNRKRKFDHAVDLGAGAGRVTKHVLLKRYDEVRLVEGDEGWSKRSKTYLGRKRASRCIFVNQRLDDLTDKDVSAWGEPADLMWIQWTLQYLTDEDVVVCLQTLAKGLRQGSGVLVVKENRPYGSAREDRFQMDTPGGVDARYDITRPDSHHRFLFQRAGLVVSMMEKGEETNTYALTR